MIYKVDQQKLIIAASAELKNHIEMPEWAKFVKTGSHRETLPRNPDWWYIRAASILRMCYKEGPVGVSKLRTRYGGRKNRGVRPDRFARAGGKVIRTILQQMEKADLLKQHTVGVHKGRSATPTGISLLTKAAKTVGVTKPEVKAPVKKVEVKAEPAKEPKPVEKTEAPKTEATQSNTTLRSGVNKVASAQKQKVSSAKAEPVKEAKTETPEDK